MVLPREQEEALCAEVKAKAAEFARSPERGIAAGYTPEQKFTFKAPGSGIDAPPLVPTRDDETAWLYGVARRDLNGYRWQILEEGPDGADLLII